MSTNRDQAFSLTAGKKSCLKPFLSFSTEDLLFLKSVQQQAFRKYRIYDFSDQVIYDLLLMLTERTNDQKELTLTNCVQLINVYYGCRRQLTARISDEQLLESIVRTFQLNQEGKVNDLIKSITQYFRKDCYV
ncbi:MAG: hypothetical protein VB012_02365 [Erysipelotrichaceae bacterium]|nr:hypothetical protein [Erysipelotrichaceae bacterium]